jgi:phospholipid/cholesterol/gamma-HCH transport system permease protein
MTFMLSAVDHIGRGVIANLRYTLRLLLMAYMSLRAAVFHQTQGLRTIVSVISEQIYFTGWQAMPLISVLAVAAGGVVILQSSSNLNLFGGSQMIGQLLVVIVLRELGPLITALVVIARSGTAVASEVGNMRANREIEALEVMGINPLSYIVFPRVFGGVISVLTLAFYFVFIALIGGFVVTTLLHNLSFAFYVDSLVKAIAVEDVYLFLLKNGFSGFIIFVVSCFQGLSVRRGPTEVPVVTTQAVVKSVGYVVFFNLGVTTLFYLSQLSKMGFL